MINLVFRVSTSHVFSIIDRKEANRETVRYCLCNDNLYCHFRCVLKYLNLKKKFNIIFESLKL